MEKPEVSALSRASEYLKPHWLENFRRSGIDEKYYGSWFFNYICSNERQQENLNKARLFSRRNLSIALLGEVGNGKTHLATAILKDSVINTNSGNPGHYYTMTGLNRSYRNAISDPEQSEIGFMNSIFNMKCLVIDEIQIKSNSESEQRMFQEIIDGRYSRNKQTIYVGNVSFDQFKEIMGIRLIDRMTENGLEVLMFAGKSYRKRSDLL